MSRITQEVRIQRPIKLSDNTGTPSKAPQITELPDDILQACTLMNFDIHDAREAAERIKRLNRKLVFNKLYFFTSKYDKDSREILEIPEAKQMFADFARLVPDYLYYAIDDSPSLDLPAFCKCANVQLVRNIGKYWGPTAVPCIGYSSEQFAQHFADDLTAMAKTMWDEGFSNKAVELRAKTLIAFGRHEKAA